MGKEKIRRVEMVWEKKCNLVSGAQYDFSSGKVRDAEQVWIWVVKKRWAYTIDTKLEEQGKATFDRSMNGWMFMDLVYKQETLRKSL